MDILYAYFRYIPYMQNANDNVSPLARRNKSEHSMWYKKQVYNLERGQERESNE